MLALQQEVEQDPAVQAVLNWQQDDGWLAYDFHGRKGIESGIRLLCEKGLEPGHPALARALAALGAHDDRLERGIGKVGPILDQRGFGGSRLIQATTFAYAGIEDRPLLLAQQQAALDGLRALLHVNSIAEVTGEYKGGLVFMPAASWPGIYHLRLLAFTHSWRSQANHRLVVQAVRKLVELSPLPNIHVRHGSQLIAPASFAMHDFNPDIDSLDDAGWMMWFHRMELLARLDVIREVPELEAQLHALACMLAESNGCFNKRLRSLYFALWSPYTGLMLEKDWRSNTRRVNDLTFRSILILHYAEHLAAR
jgi:hypothetical protein